MNTLKNSKLAVLSKLCYVGSRGFHKTSRLNFQMVQNSLKTHDHALYYTSSRRKDKSSEEHTAKKEEPVDSAKTEETEKEDEKKEEPKKPEESAKAKDKETKSDKNKETKAETKKEESKTEKKAEKKHERQETPQEKFDRLLSEVGSDLAPQLKAIYKKALEEIHLKGKAIEELTNSLKALEKANEDLRKKATELRNTVLQQVEESELQKKRLEKEVENSKVYAIQKFAKDLIEVPDNLGKALELSAKEYENKNSDLYEGVKATHAILLKTLEKHGISRINPIKEKFNPNIHEALYDYEDPQSEPGTVGQVAQAGYTIGGRLLRPAKVGIVRTPKAEGK